MFITKLALPRRTILRGIGATVALPFLDAMVPALKGQAKSAPRFATVYVGNGVNMAQWTPTTDGVDFEMTPTLKGIEAYRDRLTVFTGLDNFPATDQGDVGGQHPRAAPAFMSGTHAKATEGASRPARPSTRSSPARFAGTRSFRHWRRRSIASTSSAPATMATPART